MAITKEEYLDSEKRIRAVNELVFVRKDETSATRIVISTTAPTETNVAWVKPRN